VFCTKEEKAGAGTPERRKDRGKGQIKVKEEKVKKQLLKPMGDRVENTPDEPACLTESGERA